MALKRLSQRLETLEAAAWIESGPRTLIARFIDPTDPSREPDCLIYQARRYARQPDESPEALAERIRQTTATTGPMLLLSE